MERFSCRCFAFSVVFALVIASHGETSAFLTKKFPRVRINDFGGRLEIGCSICRTVGARRAQRGDDDVSSSKGRNNSAIPNIRSKEEDDDLDRIQRVYAISDLHTDNMPNFSWLSDRCTLHKTDHTPGSSDALIVAGDISHELSTLELTLSVLVSELDCAVFFVPGNHEAWIGGREMDEIGLTTSLEKLSAVQELCDKLGVYTSYKQLGKNNMSPVWVVPINSWYDGSLTLPGCEDLTSDFKHWPWVDFRRCEWPFLPEKNGNNGKIPVGLTEHLLEGNSIREVQSDFRGSVKEAQASGQYNGISRLPGLISFSHFLPNQQTLPDWKDLESDVFLRDQWLDHPVPEVSAKFSKVAGSNLIDRQIRSIAPDSLKLHEDCNSFRHIHVFGHSHRPKDFEFRGIRYIHNPLGKPIEREMNLASPKVDFQLIWDTTTEEGEVKGEQIIRYWEEKGGGLEALRENMSKNKWRRRGTSKAR